MGGQNFEDYIIDDSVMAMIAKGTCESKPTREDITRFLSNKGWVVNSEIEIHWCGEYEVWEWDCMIARGR